MHRTLKHVLYNTHGLKGEHCIREAMYKRLVTFELNFKRNKKIGNLVKYFREILNISSPVKDVCMLTYLNV